MEIAQIILDAILFIALAGAVFAIFVSESDGLRKASIAASIVLIVLLLGALSAVIVPAGNVGVVTAFGQVQTETLQPGLHLRLPFVNVVHDVNTQVQPHDFKEIDAASSELQTVKLTGTMNYHIDGQFASDLYQKVGDDFANKIIDPAFNDYIKTVVPEYSISDILAKRDEIRAKAKADLGANLAQYHIIVDDIYIANIAFSDAYQQAIEAKQVAQQAVQTEQQVLQQKTIQATEANAVAKGQADAIKTLAQGQADANTALTQSLTPALIQYTEIQKLNPNVSVILLPSNSNFLLPSDLFPAATKQ